RYGFAELARRHGDFALVGLAASARGTPKKLEDVRLALFGVGVTPVRARKVESVLVGGALDEKRIDQAIAALKEEIHPADDIHASSAARKHLAGVLLRRVFKQ